MADTKACRAKRHAGGCECPLCKRRSSSLRWYYRHRGVLNADTALKYAARFKLAGDQRVTAKNLRQAVLDTYGATCVCCGESASEFLTIDHVNGDGAQQRKAGIKSGAPLYRLIIREGFPWSYRILCWNCNASLGLRGHCPHTDFSVWALAG